MSATGGMGWSESQGKPIVRWCTQSHGTTTRVAVGRTASPPGCDGAAGRTPSIALDGAETTATVTGATSGKKTKIAGPDASRVVAAYPAKGVQIYHCDANGQWDEKAD